MLGLFGKNIQHVTLSFLNVKFTNVKMFSRKEALRELKRFKVKSKYLSTLFIPVKIDNKKFFLKMHNFKFMLKLIKKLE